MEPMNKPRRLWLFVTAALIGVPLLDVASFGPACWTGDRCEWLRLIRHATALRAGRMPV